jgi:hypothetical protein
MCIKNLNEKLFNQHDNGNSLDRIYTSVSTKLLYYE